MGDVVDIKSKMKHHRPTDAQRIQLLKRVLASAANYIEYAQRKGIYKDFKIDGTEVVDFLNSLQDL